MSKSIREQAVEAAQKVGAVAQIKVEGIDETLHVQRLSIEQRSSVADTGLQPGRAANVAAALNLLALAVVKGYREDDKLPPYMTREEWAAWAGEHTELFYRLAVAVNKAQGDATADETQALGND